jgi:tetratricopeptide (TPR) repeat protein
VIYAAKGDNEKAISDLNETIRLNPKDATAYYNRSSVYAEKGDNDKAISDLNEAILLDPKDAQAYYFRGVIFKDIGENTKAQKDFEEAKRRGYVPPNKETDSKPAK